VIGWNDDEAGGRNIQLPEPLMGAIRQYALPRQPHSQKLFSTAGIFDLLRRSIAVGGDLEGIARETAGAMIQLSAIILDRFAAPGHAELAGNGRAARKLSPASLPASPASGAGQCLYSPRTSLSARAAKPEEF